jgi:nickel-dependent lactate racemase
VKQALIKPSGSPLLRDLVHRGGRVLILVDDLTRPTPQGIIIPVLLDELNRIGIPDKDISLLIALGTHRKMSLEEIKARFGPQVTSRVSIFNHDYKNDHELVLWGHTPSGMSIVFNHRVLEVDVVIGCGSIVPHAQVGWAGGAKIVLPGACGAETISAMHWLAAKQPNYLQVMGEVETPARYEMERLARQVGLRFIVNVVLNGSYEPVEIVAGDPVVAHRQGVVIAQDIFLRAIPIRADIVLVEAEPADLDYWQGLKPLTVGCLAVKGGGIVILVARFRDGISSAHSELSKYGNINRDQLVHLAQAKEIDGVCAGALLQHALAKEIAQVFCVSPGLTERDARDLGFRLFPSVSTALAVARAVKGATATVGVIRKGGDVLPRIMQSRKALRREKGD